MARSTIQTRLVLSLCGASLFAFALQTVSAENSEQVKQLWKTKSCVACDLSGGSFGGASLAKADLTNSDLSKAVFYKADLRGAIPATAWSMALAALLITPAALPGLEGLPWRSVSWQAWAGLGYGATAGMVVAMTLWGRSVHRLGPTETMVYVYLEPVSAVVIAAVVLGESLTPTQALGAVVAFAGIWCAATASRGRTHDTAR